MQLCKLVGWGHFDACKELLKAGADKKAIDKNGKSPIQVAITCCQSKELQRLLSEN